MVLDVVSGSQTYDRDSRTRESNINLLEEKEKGSLICRKYNIEGDLCGAGR